MQVDFLLFGSYCLICLINLFIGIRRLKRASIIPQNTRGGKRRFVIYQPLDKFFLFLLLAMLLYISIKARELPDLDIYRRHYLTLNRNVFEIGYHWMAQLASRLHMSFELFRGLVISLSVLLMYKGIDKLGFNKNILFAIYAIYPFTVDVIQIRNFLAMGVVIYSLHFLSGREAFGRTRFCIGIAVASLVHSLSIVYLILLLANHDILKVKWKQRVLGIVFVLSILFAFLLRFSGGAQMLFYQLFLSFDKEKAMAYTHWNIQWGFLVYWLMELLYMFVAYMAYKNRFIIKMGVNYGEIFWINVVLACVFPLLTVNINFYRIYRNISIYNYALLEANATQKKRRVVLLVFIAAVILNFCMNILGDIENVFWVFFSVA